MIKLPYYKNLDGLRAIAALVVVIHHFFAYANPLFYPIITPGLKEYTDTGRYGVSLFFVLSGFVITRILINTKTEENYFKSFYFRRILRIAPLYYLFLVVWYYITPFLTHENIISFNLQLPYYLYLQNIVEYFGLGHEGPIHYWSLAVEEHFYLFWPVVIFFVPVKHISKAILSIIVIVFIVKYFMLQNGMSIGEFTFARIDQLGIGAFLSVLELKGYLKDRSKIKFFIYSALIILPLSAAVYLLSSKFPFLKDISKYFFLSIIFFSIMGLLLTTSDKSVPNRILTSKLFQYLGRISYGIYVWHMFVIVVLPIYLVTKLWWLDLTLCVFFTIVLSHLSFYYFESYFFRFKGKYKLQDKQQN